MPDEIPPGFEEHRGTVDFWEELIAKTEIDRGAPFAPDVLKRLADLKAEDRVTFEQVRACLKEKRCRVTELDKALASLSPNAERRPSHADILLELALEADLFHAPDSTGFADILIGAHRETWPIRGRGFRRWLARRFFEATKGAPSSEALQSALNVIEARAHFDGPEQVVHVRVGETGGRIYLDLGDEAWRAVEIDATGWRIIDEPPVHFCRPAGMLPLPEPARGGDLSSLRTLLNVRTEEDFRLAVAWLLAALRPRGPYPVLVLNGEQGSGKTSAARLLRGLIDPNVASQRTLPRDERDLFITATNGHVLAFDNVSSIPAWLSDALCRLATGGGFATRELFTDRDEVLLDATRPIMLNGIADLISRPDLAERAVFLALEPIAEEARRPEREIAAEIEVAWPVILGALLDAVSRGLRRLADVRLPRLPRMADFAEWATACGDGFLWEEGGFMAAFDANRAAAIEDVVEADPVAMAVRKLMAAEPAGEWKGTAQDLLPRLREMAGEDVVRGKEWPANPRALGGRLRRAAASLRQIGINLTFERKGRERARVIRISVRPSFPLPQKGGERPSAPSASSAHEENQWLNADGRADGRPSDADGSEPLTVRNNPLKTNGADGADGVDANFRPFAGDNEEGGASPSDWRVSAGADGRLLPAEDLWEGEI